jgi:succinate dehydrogenase / fumarate reductase flavoprotein subunit
VALPQAGAYFANPCYTQIHPTCIPEHGDWQSKLTLMSESLRNDGRVWVPKAKGDKRRRPHPRGERDYYLERKYPTFGNLVPRDIASRAAKDVCDEGFGVGPHRLRGVPGLPRRHQAHWAAPVIEEPLRQPVRDVPANITGENPYETPMMIYPAPHYTMGGLWVDYNLMSTCPGCSCWARPTSPTTAPTAWAPAR